MLFAPIDGDFQESFPAEGKPLLLDFEAADGDFEKPGTGAVDGVEEFLLHFPCI